MRLREERGQLLLVVLVYALVGAALVAVLIDTGTVFLHRRSLSAAADGAALAAAQAIDRSAFYRGDTGADLPLDPAAASSAVQAYVMSNNLDDRFTDFAMEPPMLSADGRVVTVRLRCSVSLPFSGGLVGAPRTVVMTVTASARTRIG